MSSNTPNISLLKKNPATDGSDTFNIETMLNQNWDKIDAVTGPASAATKGVVKIGSGIDVDGAGVISVPEVSVPVSSVNSKTGAVVLVPTDLGAAAASDVTDHAALNSSEAAKGHVQLATAAETTTGISNTKAVHPAGLKVELDKKIPKSLAMTIVQEKLINAYATLVLAGRKTIEQVPEMVVLLDNETESTIRKEVDIKVAEKTIKVLT